MTTREHESIYRRVFFIPLSCLLRIVIRSSRDASPEIPFRRMRHGWDIWRESLNGKGGGVDVTITSPAPED